MLTYYEIDYRRVHSKIVQFCGTYVAVHTGDFNRFTCLFKVMTSAI